jgi:hypothetical protein
MYLIRPSSSLWPACATLPASFAGVLSESRYLDSGRWKPLSFGVREGRSLMAKKQCPKRSASIESSPPASRLDQNNSAVLNSLRFVDAQRG